MNRSFYLLCTLFTATVLLWSPHSYSSLVGYTYDPAGRLVTADYGANHTISYAYDNTGNLLLSSQPALAITVVSLVGNQITLSWPINPTGFVLQSTTDLSSGAVWNNVGIASTPSGNLNFVTLTLSGTTTFFRLKK